jgi:hypothetical protein
MSADPLSLPTQPQVQPQPRQDDISRVSRNFAWLALVGFAGAVFYCAVVWRSPAKALALLGGAVLISGVFGLLGGLMGFVFAIPRSRQNENVVSQNTTSGSAEGPRRLSDYSANTNLEQISDWLTKILVGIGLVQFNNIVTRFKSAADALSPMLGTEAAARSVTLALMGYFLAWGFFLAYLLTRLWLPKALSRAETEEKVQNEKTDVAVAALRTGSAALRALEAQTYANLYEPRPGGFTRAIQAIDDHISQPQAVTSPQLWLYRAAAYGQKHAFEKSRHNEQQSREARDAVVASVREALRRDPGTRPILKQLYEGKDERENDLYTLKGDPELEELLGGPQE